MQRTTNLEASVVLNIDMNCKRKGLKSYRFLFLYLSLFLQKGIFSEMQKKYHNGECTYEILYTTSHLHLIYIKHKHNIHIYLTALPYPCFILIHSPYSHQGKLLQTQISLYSITYLLDLG